MTAEARTFYCSSSVRPFIHEFYLLEDATTVESCQSEECSEEDLTLFKFYHFNAFALEDALFCLVVIFILLFIL